ncbi:MAG: ribonuclease D [Proteobacteria bacterium]|nr:ribonuclease D [Pseudomonadota bacterium]
MNKKQSDYFIITKQKQLKAYLDKIKDEKVLFIDTEFHSERLYYAELCLIQIATTDTCVAIDPVVNNLDLTEFVKFLDNDNIMKIFHAGRQDLEIFYKLNNNKPIKNIFDTQVAALAVGLGDQIGYANLVKSLLNVSIDKSQQVANWLNRPLSKDQLDYAMDDVIYLKEIYKKLVKTIEKKKRLNLIKGELKKLESEATFSPNIEGIMRKIKVKDTAPLTVEILRNLVKFRESEAQKLNKQRNVIFRDDFLGFCARLKPTDIEELESVRGVTKRILSKYSDAIVEIINKTIDTPIEEIVKAEGGKNLPSIDTSLKTLAKFLLQLKAKEHSISLKLVTDDADLINFLKKPTSPSKLRETWRWDLFGKDLDLLRQGKLSITTNGKKVILLKEESED